ncbi:hypothetical protein BASA61_000241 [Batrachochytrium salamandrivorans]|nr:hypothetical protein BASA61_000241 [Batrachochytrium salamandrivorans]
MAPYCCFYATTEVEFTFIEGDADITKNPTVVVTSTAKHPDLLALFGEDYSKIQAGDELLAINGLSFVKWFEKNKFKYGFGANEFGGQRAALKYLTTIYGKTTVCQVKTLSISSSNPELTPRQLYCQCPPESANMGIIKLDSFNPEDVGTKSLAVLKAVMIIRSLLANELKDTQLGHNIFVDGKDPDVDPYAKAWQETEEGSRFTNVFFLTRRIGVTQSVRTGRYKGQDIEDVGIKTDTVVRPRWSDLQPTPTTNTQYDRIAASLARTGQENGQIEAAGIEEFTVFQADGKTVAAKQKESPPTNKSSPSQCPLLVVLSVTTESPLLARLQGNRCSRQTVTNIDSSIEAFFTAPVGTEINIGLNVDFDTEPDCDFLYLSVKSSDGVEDFLLSSKSRDGTQDVQWDLWRNMLVEGTIPFTTKSEKFSVSLKFTSDNSLSSLVLLSTRSLSLLLEIFWLVYFGIVI